MRQRKVIKTTLGDLIAAVTDEVRRFVLDPSDLYVATSCVLNDLLAHQQVYVSQKPRRTYSNSVLKCCTNSSRRTSSLFALQLV